MKGSSPRPETSGCHYPRAPQQSKYYRESHGEGGLGERPNLVFGVQGAEELAEDSQEKSVLHDDVLPPGGHPPSLRTIHYHHTYILI